MTSTKSLAKFTASHAKRVRIEQLIAFIDQLSAKNPERGTADDIRLETFALELRNRPVQA